MAAHPLVQRSYSHRVDFFRNHEQILTRLSTEGQSPESLFIGCDDSRVIPEAIVGARPGDLFVMRNIANIIPPYGLGELAVGATLEYGLRHLPIGQIIVCGHTDCGGIQALDMDLDPLSESYLSRWIEFARPAQTRVEAWGVDPDVRHRKIVEQNVLLQLQNLQTYEVVREALKAEQLTLHGWVYDLSNGRISYWDATADGFITENAGQNHSEPD